MVSVGNLRSCGLRQRQYGFGLGNDDAAAARNGFSGMTGDRVQGLRIFNTPIQMQRRAAGGAVGGNRPVRHWFQRYNI